MILTLKSVVLLGALAGGLGLAPSMVVARSKTWALALTPTVGALVCATAVVASLLTRTGMVPWLLGLGALGWLLAWQQRRLGPLLTRADEPPLPVLGAALAVALVPPMLVDLPPTTHDARTIWWMHATWYHAGGELAREAMGNPAYGFTAPAHPPLVSSVIASVWHLRGTRDLVQALGISQVFTAAAIAALAFFVVQTLRVHDRVALVVAVGVVAAGWGANASVGLVGLLDLTWAAIMVTGAVLLLAADTERRTAVTGALFVCAAALTKTEGQVAALLLLALVLLRARHHWRRAGPAVFAVFAALVGWAAVVRPKSDYTGDWSQLTGVLSPDNEVHRRLIVSVPRLASDLGPLVGLGVLVVVAIVVLSRLTRTPLDQPGLLGLLALTAAYLVFLTLTFAVRPDPPARYLPSTAYRTIIFVRMAVLVDVVLAVVAAARAGGLLAPRLAPKASTDHADEGIDIGHALSPASPGTPAPGRTAP